MSKHQISLEVNGRSTEAWVDPNLSLLELLRDEGAATEVKLGCGEGVCGTCTVLLDGEPVKSCTILAVQADGARITTVEGLEQNGKLHPVQEAFWEKHGLQCGYCTPGMLMTGCALLARNKDPTEPEIRDAISGNLCRCTGYSNIVKAIQSAAERLRQQ
jgi:carbon-monoxide dehydrogenase small subunit